MRKVTKEFEIYKFDELEDFVKNIIVGDYIESWLQFTDYNKLDKESNLYKAIKQAEELRTPWFTTQYVYDYCKDEILDNVRKYEYYKNGKIYID